MRMVEAGRRLELDWMSGAVARIGDELGAFGRLVIVRLTKHT
jgi:hypothetical protein